MRRWAILLAGFLLCLAGCGGIQLPGSGSPPASGQGASRALQLDEERVSKNAEALTEHLAWTIFSAEKVRNGEYPPPDDADMTRFMVAALFYRENEDHPYHHMVSLDDEGYCHYPKAGIQAMAEEVFGVEDWLPDLEKSGLSYRYEEAAGDFLILSGFGIGNNLECRNKSTTIDRDGLKVSVAYELYTSSAFPDPHRVASAKTGFSICFREDGSHYLRYSGTTE